MVFVSSDKSAEELMAYMKVVFLMIAIRYTDSGQIHDDHYMAHSGFANVV